MMFKRGDIMETHFAGKPESDGIAIVVIDHPEVAKLNWIVQTNSAWYFHHRFPVPHDVQLSERYVTKIGEATL